MNLGNTNLEKMMQTAEELAALRNMGPPAAEIKFQMKNGDKVIVRTAKLPGSPNYTYTATINAGSAIILYTMSCPGHDDIIRAYTAHRTANKPEKD